MKHANASLLAIVSFFLKLPALLEITGSSSTSTGTGTESGTSLLLWLTEETPPRITNVYILALLI